MWFPAGMIAVPFAAGQGMLSTVRLRRAGKGEVTVTVWLP